MVLVFTESKCGICNETIQANAETRSFPAFLKPTHPLYRFSDAVFHRSCFDMSPDRDEVNRLLTRFREIWDSRSIGLETVEEINACGNDSFKEFE